MSSVFPLHLRRGSLATLASNCLSRKRHPRTHHREVNVEVTAPLARADRPFHFNYRTPPGIPPLFFHLTFITLSYDLSAMATTTNKPNEKALSSPRYSTTSLPNHTSVDTVSPGVARIEATTSHLTRANRVCIFLSVLLLAWAYSLDNTLRPAYQTMAVSGLNAHALLASVSVVRAVIGAAAQVRCLFRFLP